MSDKKWHRPSWMKEAAKEMAALRDKSLRKYIHHLYNSLHKKMTDDKARPDEVLEYDFRIVVNCKVVLVRYQLMVTQLLVDSVPNERARITKLILMLFEKAYGEIKDNVKKEEMAQILSDFTRLSWPKPD